MMYYQIFRINPIEKDDFCLSAFDDKYFWNALKNNISYFTGYNYYIYKIFNIYLCVKWADCKEKLNTLKIPHITPYEDTFHYYAFYCNTTLEDVEVSQNIRGTNTLIITDDNKITNNYKTVVIDQKGFGVFSNKQDFEDTERYFLWALNCVLLALAYNYTATDFIKKTITLYKEKNTTKELIKQRNEMFAFAIENYYRCPIAEGRSFIHEIWEKVSAILNVQNIHDEMKFQIQDIVNIIETEQSNSITKRYNTQTLLLGIFGIIFTFIGVLPFALKIIDYFYGLSPFWKIFIK